MRLEGVGDRDRTVVVHAEARGSSAMRVVEPAGNAQGATVPVRQHFTCRGECGARDERGGLVHVREQRRVRGSETEARRVDAVRVGGRLLHRVHVVGVVHAQEVGLSGAHGLDHVEPSRPRLPWWREQSVGAHERGGQREAFRSQRMLRPEVVRSQGCAVDHAPVHVSSMPVRGRTTRHACGRPPLARKPGRPQALSSTLACADDVCGDAPGRPADL